MAKKKKSKRNPKRRRSATGYAKRNAAKKNPRRRSSRRRSNPAGGSYAFLFGGLLLGGVAAGVVDYGMGGMPSTATPTVRALVEGAVAVGLGVGAAMTDGGASAMLLGSSGAFAGVAGANGTRAVAMMMTAPAIKTASPAANASTSTTVNADGSMAALVMRALVPAPTRANVAASAPAALSERRNVMDMNRLRGLVVDRRG